MNEHELILLFKALSDKSRLQILKSLYQEDMYVERLAERLNLSAPTITFHLKKLQEADAVKSYKNQYYTMYAINKMVFDMNIMDILKETSETASILIDRDIAYQKRVIDSFFKYDKLISIPVQKKKRQIVLNQISKQFMPNIAYQEKTIHLILADIYDDFVLLKKELIANHNLTVDSDGSYYLVI